MILDASTLPRLQTANTIRYNPNGNMQLLVQNRIMQNSSAIKNAAMNIGPMTLFFPDLTIIPPITVTPRKARAMIPGIMFSTVEISLESP